MARTKLSTLNRIMRLGGSFTLKRDPERHDFVQFIQNGTVQFTASRDDLFDRNGNRFEDDLP